MRGRSVSSGKLDSISSLGWSLSVVVGLERRHSISWVQTLSFILVLPNWLYPGRPELKFALTKLHVFRLHTLFSTLIYLDADVLPIRRLSHLFTSTSPHTISACPDTGWPDCFNSGVMVIRPRESDWVGLRKLLENGEGEEGIYEGGGNGSFDGADQGLLNEWFSEEGGGGAWNRLPFL